jgi:hypothetical protein
MVVPLWFRTRQRSDLLSIRDAMAKNTSKHQHRLQAAYALHLPALLAIDPRQIQRPRVDLAALSATVLAALPRLSPKLPALAKQLVPGLDPALVLEFPTRLMALLHAQANLTAYVAPRAALPELLDRGRIVRGLLFRAAVTLVDFERLPSGSLTAMATRRTRAKSDVAMDLLSLAALYRQHWAAVEPHTAVPPLLVEEAARLGDELLTALGQRDQKDAGEAEVVQLRDRAFTHFRPSYRAVRRVLDFVYGREMGLGLLPNVFDWRRFGGGGGGKK